MRMYSMRYFARRWRDIRIDAQFILHPALHPSRLLWYQSIDPDWIKGTGSTMLPSTACTCRHTAARCQEKGTTKKKAQRVACNQFMCKSGFMEDKRTISSELKCWANVMRRKRKSSRLSPSPHAASFDTNPQRRIQRPLPVLHKREREFLESQSDQLTLCFENPSRNKKYLCDYIITK